MSWGPHPGWLALVVIATSVAAMGLAMLVAAAARTETQVAIYGTLLVLVLAALSGRSEEHTSELQSRLHLVCRLLLEKKKTNLETSPFRALHGAAQLNLGGHGLLLAPIRRRPGYRAAVRYSRLFGDLCSSAEMTARYL